MHNHKKKTFLFVVIGVFLLSFCWPNPSFASTNRTMQVESIIGTVYLQKAGGFKSIQVYKGMHLQQGDRLQTSEDSSVGLRTSDTKDELIIGENANLYIASLQTQQGNNKTKLAIWSGTIYAKVTPLTQSKDSFEIVTSHSEYSVRGTNFFVGVDPQTGASKLFLASGYVGVAKPRVDTSSNPVILVPNQMLQTGFDDTNYTAPIDLDMFISNSSPAIIEAILRNKAEIDKENQEYIEQQRALLQGDQSNRDLDRIQSNLEKLVGNIVNTAIKQGVVNQSAIQDLIDKANESQDRKLDLNNIKPPELTEMEKQKQEQIKRMEAQRQQQLEEQKKKQEDMRAQNQALVQKLEEQRKKMEEANRAMADAKKKQAEELYLSRLAAAEREAFEARKNAFEAANAKIPRVEESTPTRPPSSEERDQRAANEVIAAISALALIEELTLDHLDNVVMARDAFDRLTERQMGLVDNLDILQEAEVAMSELMEEDIDEPGDSDGSSDPDDPGSDEIQPIIPD